MLCRPCSFAIIELYRSGAKASRDMYKFMDIAVSYVTLFTKTDCALDLAYGP
jgi:23S rRNA U2552 (ribose-2'-O)-methylase RlmE/FtsJ